MIRTTLVQPGDAAAESAFIDFPFRLYSGCEQWVPPFRRSVRKTIRGDHPFYEHAEGAFFLTWRDDEVVGRIAVFENTAHSAFHGVRAANFYYFDCVDDTQAADATFESAFSWARERDLTRIYGPTFSGGAGATGALVDGFDERSAMTMMAYNYEYYTRLYQENGFEKRLDLLSARLDPDTFVLPDRIERIADLVLKRKKLWVKEFTAKRELRRYVEPITDLYEKTLVHNAENYPLSAAELAQVAEDLLFVADPKLIKLLMHDEDVVGFLFAFPDLSAALKRSDGHLNPVTLIDILLEFRRTRSLIINGAGIHPDYQKMGGNALLYSVLEKTGRQKAYDHVDLTQVAETTELMISDLKNLGAQIYKRHRLYTRPL